VLDGRVDLISFTGSSVTGRRIMEKGAATLKRVFLELGGKSAMIVTPDADFEATLPMAAMVCMHGGQGCALHTRLLVPRDRYDESVELVAAAMDAITYGDPADPSNIQGPQISKKQQDRVLDYIRIGQEEGARLVTGGNKPPQFGKGYFVEPTLFADVTNEMRIAREEIFGPVQTVIAYEDVEDAIRIANDSDFGLSAQVAAGTIEQGLAIADRLRTGTVAVNGGVFYGADSPYGGYKYSGIGRQNGIEGFEQYTETKVISQPGEA
jgi:aldehyde dehydrogenase (NAD+)